MEKNIKTILNYDADNATEHDRKILIDTVMELFLSMIAKDKRFNKLEKIDYTFSNDIRGGSYGVSGLKLNSGIFGHGEEYYLNDLSVLFHELFHYAQDNFVDQSALAKSDSRMICVSTHFYSLILFILNREYPEYMQYANIFGLKTVFGMNEDLNKIRNYFHSYYELQSFEVEANKFSIDALKTFVRETEKLKLTHKKKLF